MGWTDPKVKEAHDAAVAEPGGWYVPPHTHTQPRPLAVHSPFHFRLSFG